MFNAILRRFSPIPKLDAFSRYLFIGPHPDDIEVACAPSVRALTRAGKHVTFLVLTDGCMGAIDPALSSEALVEIRRAEALASAKLLGVTDVVFLPFHDGGMYPWRTQPARSRSKSYASSRMSSSRPIQM